MVYLKELFLYTFDFVGVASRKNFWITFLTVFSINLVLCLACFLLDVFFIIEILFAVVTLVPMLALVVRRLHDTDRSAWNLCWIFFPFVGVVVLIVYCSERTKYII